MASYCSLSNSRLGLPSFSKENLIAFQKSPSRPRSQTPSCIRTSRLRSLTGITRILLFKTDFPRVLRFPVPLDKGNEGSGDEIVRHVDILHVKHNARACVSRKLSSLFAGSTFSFSPVAKEGPLRLAFLNRIAIFKSYL